MHFFMNFCPNLKIEFVNFNPILFPFLSYIVALQDLQTSYGPITYNILYFQKLNEVPEYL